MKIFRADEMAQAQERLHKLKAQWHSGCVVCGTANALGLCLDFEVEEDGRVQAQFSCPRELAGFDDCLHGGVITALLDGAMTNCLFAHGQVGMTAELRIRFHEPVDTGRPATVWAKIERSGTGLQLLHAELVQGGKIKAVAAGKFMAPPPAVRKIQTEKVENKIKRDPQEEEK